MIASVKQGESVSSERYKKNAKGKETDALAHGAGDHMKQEDGREGRDDRLRARSGTTGSTTKRGRNGKSPSGPVMLRSGYRTSSV